MSGRTKSVRGLETTTLYDGAIVLAKTWEGRLWAKTFANQTQAERARDRAGEGWGVFQWGRPFFVAKVNADGTLAKR